MRVNMTKISDAFSLLEIMVAIFIVAILVGISIPSYLSHVNKSKVSAALTTLSALEHAAKIAYEENTSNSNITYGGTTLNNNTITALNIPPVVNGLYIRPNGNANVGAAQFLVCVYVTGLNFSGYVKPTAGQPGTYARICKQVTANDPIYTNKCGSLENSATDIPTRYLPQGCNCANIWAGTC